MPPGLWGRVLATPVTGTPAHAFGPCFQVLRFATRVAPAHGLLPNRGPAAWSSRQTLCPRTSLRARHQAPVPPRSPAQSLFFTNQPARRSELPMSSWAPRGPVCENPHFQQSLCVGTETKATHLPSPTHQSGGRDCAQGRSLHLRVDSAQSRHPHASVPLRLRPPSPGVHVTRRGNSTGQRPHGRPLMAPRDRARDPGEGGHGTAALTAVGAQSPAASPALRAPSKGRSNPAGRAGDGRRCLIRRKRIVFDYVETRSDYRTRGTAYCRTRGPSRRRTKMWCRLPRPLSHPHRSAHRCGAACRAEHQAWLA